MLEVPVLYKTTKYKQIDTLYNTIYLHELIKPIIIRVTLKALAASHRGAIWRIHVALISSPCDHGDCFHVP